MESNFSDTYPYLRIGSCFLFNTVQNIPVTVDISRDQRFFPDNPEIAEVFHLFIKTDRPPMGLDVRLRNTVLDILAAFLKENEAIIIYYCEPHDGKGYLRHAKFNRWFNFMNDPSIEKQDRQVVIVDLKVDEHNNLIRFELPVYASILLRRTHPNYRTAIRLFYSGEIDKTGKL